MKRNSVNYIDNTYRTLETEYPRHELVIEGREEILLILTSLRRGSTEARDLAKLMWKTHSGFSRCPSCGRLSKHFNKGYYSFHRGYDSWVCSKCYDTFTREYRKNKEASNA